MKPCYNCNKELTGDESAIYRKLVNKLAHDCLCIPCLAVNLNCEETQIFALIKHYRENRVCGLFK